MTNHPNRKSSARKIAKAAGYYIRQGSFAGTADDRLDRWYFGHIGDNGFRPYGAGHPSQVAAWNAAAEHAQQTNRD